MRQTAKQERGDATAWVFLPASITLHVDWTTCMQDPQLMHVAAGQMSTEKKKKKAKKNDLESQKKRQLRETAAALQGNLEAAACWRRFSQPALRRLLEWNQNLFHVMSPADPCCASAALLQELTGRAGTFWLCLTGVKLPSDQGPAALR